MSNEVKIGLLTIIAIALGFWGYKFILGQNMLVKSNVYYIEYSDVDGMKKGTSVSINGVQVGSVTKIELLYDQTEKVKVTLDLNKDVKIPQNTIAQIISSGFMGGKVIELIYDKPCTDDCAPSGSYLKGRTLGMMASMIGKEGLSPYMEQFKDGLGDILDTLNRELLDEESDSPLAKSIRDLQGTLSNLNSASYQLDVIIRKSTGKLDGTLDNLYTITGTVSQKSEDIAGIIDNANTVTGQLADADIGQTMEEVNASIANLKQTLNQAEAAVGNINGLVSKINSGQGSLGKLLNDDELYNDLTEMSYSVDSLATDFQERPYRYIPFKSRKKVKRFDRKDAALEESK